MAAPGPEEREGDAPLEAELPDRMHVERERLDDGRALLLFTWDEPA